MLVAQCLPKALFRPAFSLPMDSRDDGPRQIDEPFPHAVGTKGSCAGGTRYSLGAGS